MVLSILMFTRSPLKNKFIQVCKILMNTCIDLQNLTLLNCEVSTHTPGFIHVCLAVAPSPKGVYVHVPQVGRYAESRDYLKNSSSISERTNIVEV